MTTLAFFVPGPPVPCGRPRLGAHGNVYTPRETQDYERHVATVAMAHAVMRRWHKAEAGEPLHVKLAINRGKGKRGDIDNIAKSVLDGITKAQRVWVDDRDVMRLEVTMDTSGSNIGVHVEVTQ